MIIPEFELCQCGHIKMHHYDERGPCYVSEDGYIGSSNDCNEQCMEFKGTGKRFSNWVMDWDNDFVHPFHGHLTLDHLQMLEAAYR